MIICPSPEAAQLATLRDALATTLAERDAHAAARMALEMEVGTLRELLEAAHESINDLAHRLTDIDALRENLASERDAGDDLLRRLSEANLMIGRLGIALELARTPVDYDAKPGHVWVCKACGKRSGNRIEGTISHGWDESCFIHAVHWRTDSMAIDLHGLVVNLWSRDADIAMECLAAIGEALGAVRSARVMLALANGGELGGPE